MVLFQQMILFACMMLLGFFCAKKGILDRSVAKSISWIVVNIANPALILSGCLGGSTMEKQELLVVVIVSFAVYTVLVPLARLLMYTFVREKRDQGLYECMLIFSNMGFMGLPLMSAVYGAQSVMYLSLFMIPFNILIYTYGISRMKDGTIENKVNGWKNLQKIVNPGVVASIFAMIICLCDISLPGMPVKLADSLGALTGPLSMMVIGASFADIQIVSLFKDWKLYLYAFYKLLLIPILGICMIRQFVSTKELLGACFVVLAAPTASMTVMFSKHLRSEDAIATKVVAFSTLLSVVTMPLVMSILKL